LDFVRTHRLERLIKKSTPHDFEKGTCVLNILVFLTQQMETIVPMTCGPKAEGGGHGSHVTAGKISWLFVDDAKNQCSPSSQAGIVKLAVPVNLTGEGTELPPTIELVALGLLVDLNKVPPATMPDLDDFPEKVADADVGASEPVKMRTAQEVSLLFSSSFFA